MSFVEVEQLWIARVFQDVADYLAVGLPGGAEMVCPRGAVGEALESRR